MEEKKWVETKKECEVNEDGNLVVKQVTLEIEKSEDERKQELTRKDLIDLAFRAIALLAIGIPVVLFYFQQSAERDRQRAALQIEAYSSVSILLHELIENRELNNDRSGFESKRLRLLHEYTPKLLLCTGDDSLVYHLQKVNNDLETYSSYRTFLDLSDSILDLSMDKVTSLWNALTRVNRSLPIAQSDVESLALAQKSLAKAIWSYRSSLSQEQSIYDLFDSLIIVHDLLAESLYDFGNLNNELVSLETIKLSTPEKTLIHKLMRREELSPECFRVLEGVGRIASSLGGCHRNLEDCLPVMKNQLQRLDRRFVETNRYLSED